MRCLGIDVSSTTLDVALWDADANQWLDEQAVANAPDGHATLVAFCQEAEHQPELIVLEATGAYHAPLLAALVAAQLPVCLVNPAQVKAYRQTQLGRTKTDRQDARRLARFGTTYATELRRYQPPSPVQQQLRRGVHYRETLVAERTRLLNQQHAADWQADGQVQDWLGERLGQITTQLTQVDAAIATLLAQIPEATELQTLCGVGPRVAAATLAYLPATRWGQPKAAAA